MALLVLAAHTMAGIVVALAVLHSQKRR
jgi:hypothetical protein